eukprot:3615285-Pyramimonas_sp.AAC.1
MAGEHAHARQAMGESFGERCRSSHLSSMCGGRASDSMGAASLPGAAMVCARRACRAQRAASGASPDCARASAAPRARAHYPSAVHCA